MLRRNVFLFTENYDLEDMLGLPPLKKKKKKKRRGKGGKPLKFNGVQVLLIHDP